MLKDGNYLKFIQEKNGFKPLTTEASAYLLSQVELIFRQAVKRSVKLSKKLKRKTLSNKEFKVALEDMNLSFLSKYTKRNADIFLLNKEDKPKLYQEVLPIQIEMQNIILEGLKPSKTIKLDIDWFILKGEINKQSIEDQERFKLNIEEKRNRLDLNTLIKDAKQEEREYKERTFFLRDLGPIFFSKREEEIAIFIKTLIKELFVRIDRQKEYRDWKDYFQGELISSFVS